MSEQAAFCYAAKIELNNTNLFPDLVPIKTNTQTNIEECKFKHILTNIIRLDVLYLGFIEHSHAPPFLKTTHFLGI